MANETIYSSFVALMTDATVPWLRGVWGNRWIRALGGETDDLATQAKDAVKTRFPLECADDALAPLGLERRILRGPTEEASTYRPRVWGAWESWRWSGTDYGVAHQAMGDAGWTTETFDPDAVWPVNWMDDGNVWIVQNSDWNALDGDVAFWSRFWLIVDGHDEGITDDGTWGSGTWGDGGVWGFDLTDAIVNMWRQVIRQFKQGGTHCPGGHGYPGMYVILSAGKWADVWGSLGHWGGGDEGVWGGHVRSIDVGEKTS